MRRMVEGPLLIEESDEGSIVSSYCMDIEVSALSGHLCCLSIRLHAYDVS